MDGEKDNTKKLSEETCGRQHANADLDSKSGCIYRAHRLVLNNFLLPTTNRKEEKLKMASQAVQKLLLVLSICLIVFGLGVSIAGVFSPAWQVVDIREFRAEHQHGLWWDCIRAERHVVAVGDFYDEAPLHCMYKFDESAELVIENAISNVDRDGAAGEAEHHQFWAWKKAVLFFIIFSQILAFVSICTGVCAPCFYPTAFIFTISIFAALVCSVIADGVFFLGANRVDNRFVQGMVGTYEQRIGYAFFLHLSGTVCWCFAFICAIATTYKFFTGRGSSSSRRHSPPSRVENEPFLEHDGHCGPPTPMSRNGKTATALRPVLIGSRASPAPQPATRVYRETCA